MEGEGIMFAIFMSSASAAVHGCKWHDASVTRDARQDDSRDACAGNYCLEYFSRRLHKTIDNLW